MFSKLFIYRPIFAAVISIVIVIVGLIALVTLPVARYPEIAPPTVEVTAVYPGANAQTVAQTVAKPIEQEVNGVEGMAYMSSISTADGQMVLTVTFDVGTDLDMANVLVQNRVSVATPKLPEEVQRQGVEIKKKSPEITLFIALYSPNGEMGATALNNYANLYIVDELKRIEGVGDVNAMGTGDYGMRVWLDPNKLKARGLTTGDVVNAIREQNIEVAAGMIGEPPAPPTQAFQYTVNTQGRLVSPEEFENIIIRSSDEGQLTYVKDVARVEVGSQTYGLDALYNNQPTAAIAVYQLPGANAINVADQVEAKLKELSLAFPNRAGAEKKTLDYEIAYDATQIVRSSIREVITTLFITLGLVVFTVYIFLQNFRATLIPTVTIPVSLIGTFGVMLLLGFSLNQLTLFGLVLVIGIVVDDAIVVVENTTRLIEKEGLRGKEAALQSMKEVTGPVIATTLVLLAVFVPTIFIPGLSGQLFKQFAVTISVATIFSSINALTLSPSLCGILLKPRGEKKQLFIWRAFNGFIDKLTLGLGAVVQRVLRVAVVGLIFFVGIVFIAGYGFSTLPTGFVPQEDEGYCVMNIQLPDGAAMHRTKAVLEEVTAKVEKVKGVKDVMGIVGYSLLDGSRTSNIASMLVTFEHWDERQSSELSQDSILRQLNGIGQSIQEATVLAFAPPSLPGVGMAGGFALQLQDRQDVGLRTLEQVAGEFVADGTNQSGIGYMFSGFRANNPQLYLDIDREQVRKLGLNLQDVNDTLGAYLGSAYVNDYIDFGRIYQVKVQADADYRASPEDIRKLEVRNKDGKMIPLGTVLDVEEVFGPQLVTHYNIYPSAKINGGTSPGFSSGQAMQIIRSMADQKLPRTMGFEWTDLSYQEAKAGGALIIFIFGISVLLVYLVLAAQYESWSLPLSVCLAVPTALLGSVAAIILRGYDANVYTQIGIVLLIGLSTKTAILIVEFAKVQREEGKPPGEAAVFATKLRFRAVLMTAVSFILGVLPLLVASGAGAESRKAIGTCVFGGMVVATCVSVVTVPMLYFVIQVISEKMGGGKKPVEIPKG